MGRAVPRVCVYFVYFLFSFYTSKQQGKGFEVKKRIVYGVTSLGKELAGAKKLCALMNMPPPPDEEKLFEDFQRSYVLFAIYCKRKHEQKSSDI